MNVKVRMRIVSEKCTRDGKNLFTKRFRSVKSVKLAVNIVKDVCALYYTSVNITELLLLKLQYVDSFIKLNNILLYKCTPNFQSFIVQL